MARFWGDLPAWLKRAGLVPDDVLDGYRKTSAPRALNAVASASSRLKLAADGGAAWLSVAIEQNKLHTESGRKRHETGVIDDMLRTVSMRFTSKKSRVSDQSNGGVSRDSTFPNELVAR